MDGKFFPLRDSRWARLMDDEVNERYAPEVHLAALTDQVLWQVIRGLDPSGEILLTAPIHLPHIGTSPLTHPRRTPQDLVDSHELHLFHIEQVSPVITLPGLAGGELIRWLLRCHFRNGFQAWRTQAILAAVPTLKRSITAETGGGTSIRARF
jgi:hypothetical protein